MDKKIVFLDIDGTLLDRNNRIPSSTKNAIKKLKEGGIEVAIATGRPPIWFSHILNELDLMNYVSFNGSYVVFNGESLLTNPLNSEELSKFVEFANEKEQPMVFLNEKEIYANHSSHPFIHESIGGMDLQHPPFNKTFHLENDVYQALLFIEEKDSPWYKDHSQFDYVRWHEKAIDILPSGGSKAKGIEAMLKAMGIPKENSYAFGDGWNDIEMLKYVGCGVAMGNAVIGAKEAADIVTNDVEEDGLYKGLLKLDLIKE
ncbi:MULTISPECIES: Cof-type HAD-IIB family hydrolase [Bacillaceae]|uniref:Cof-type HAD-IIB family hydrolase n=1 Tax=Evansella alkalicola TaxID=745819 RepID=A0ABS6JPU8_9BACI|nr:MULTISPECIES: Cof-type HAD-IIB family hydrolase [Bacillaceae]MBU9720513.1 Cof-type HAD-IIB family hydrolase [Bacillus alkalicola]